MPLQPGLALRVREVSDANQKGKHTTTTAQLIKLDVGGWVVDTPGIRQLQLWDIRPEEVEGFFPEFRPFVPLCLPGLHAHARSRLCRKASRGLEADRRPTVRQLPGLLGRGMTIVLGSLSPTFQTPGT